MVLTKISQAHCNYVTKLLKANMEKVKLMHAIVISIILYALESYRDKIVVVVVLLLKYVHGTHLRSCRDGQLTQPHFSWAGLDLLSG